MEKVLLDYFAMFAIALIFAVLFAAQNSKTAARKWVKVRVRMDDRERRQLDQPRDDEFDSPPSFYWLIFGTVILLFFAVLSLR